MRKLIWAAAAALLLSTAAHAEWITTVEDDLFSDNKIAVMIGMVSINASIYAKCTGPDAIELAYIEATSDAGGLSEPVKAGDIVFKGDNGERHSSETSIYTHNDKYVGFSFDDTDQIPDVIRDFGEADSKISVGLDLILNDGPSTTTASARGSSKAVKQFLEACSLAE